MNKIICLIGCALLGALAGWLCDEKDVLIAFLIMITTTVIVVALSLYYTHSSIKKEEKKLSKPKLCDSCDNYSFPFEGCQMCDGEDFYRPKEVQQ